MLPFDSYNAHRIDRLLCWPIPTSTCAENIRPGASMISRNCHNPSATPACITIWGLLFSPQLCVGSVIHVHFIYLHPLLFPSQHCSQDKGFEIFLMVFLVSRSWTSGRCRNGRVYRVNTASIQPGGWRIRRTLCMSCLCARAYLCG